MLIPQTLQKINRQCRACRVEKYWNCWLWRRDFWAWKIFGQVVVKMPWWLKNKGTLQKTADHPIMQPNPTSYQLYLEQNEKILAHWDEVNATLHGYKLYRHNSNFDWPANPDELRENCRRLQNNQEPLTKTLKPCKSAPNLFLRFILKIWMRLNSARWWWFLIWTTRKDFIRKSVWENLWASAVLKVTRRFLLRPTPIKNLSTTAALKILMTKLRQKICWRFQKLRCRAEYDCHLAKSYEWAEVNFGLGQQSRARQN